MVNRHRALFCLLLLWLIVSPVRAQQGSDTENVTLTILHTNDLHGHMLPFAYIEIGRSMREQPSVGGAARRATLIRRIKANLTNPVVLIDSGDTFTRGPLTNTYLGIADVEAMNAVGYEIAAVGNNEFKAKDGAEQSDSAGSQAALLNLIKRSRFPWLCANATDEKGAILEGIQPFVVRKYGPLRVGFLGLTSPKVANYPQAKGWTISDPIETARKYIPIVRAQCDVLIAVTHIGVALDKQLAARTTGIDAIVGGDTHTFLYKALEVRNADDTMTVPIVQDGEFGADLGRFDLSFAHKGDGWHLAAYKSELIPVGPDLPEARDVAAVIEPYSAPLMSVVGTLPADKIGKTTDDRLRLTTEVFLDAMRRRTGADIAMSPSGLGFFEVFRSTRVRRYDVYAAMPFNDHAVVGKFTGAQIEKIMNSEKDTVVSGDVTHMDPTQTYRVTFIDYIASSVYKLQTGQEVEDTGRNIRDLVIADLSEKR